MYIFNEAAYPREKLHTCVLAVLIDGFFNGTSPAGDATFHSLILRL